MSIDLKKLYIIIGASWQRWEHNYFEMSNMESEVKISLLPQENVEINIFRLEPRPAAKL